MSITLEYQGRRETIVISAVNEQAILVSVVRFIDEARRRGVTIVATFNPAN